MALSEQFIPSAFADTLDPISDLDRGITPTCLNGLEVGTAYAGFLGKSLLGHPLAHSEPIDVLAKLFCIHRSLSCAFDLFS